MTVQAAVLPMDQAERIPTSAMPEADLIRGYSRIATPAPAEVPCACGGFVAAVSDFPDAIRIAVARHNRSTAHRALVERWAKAR